MAPPGDAYQRLGSYGEPEVQPPSKRVAFGPRGMLDRRRCCIVSTVVVVGCCLTVAAAHLEGGVGSSSREQVAESCQALGPAVPCTKDAYTAWVTRYYAAELQNITNSADARFAALPQCKGMSTTACATLVYSLARSPAAHGACEFAANKTMNELRELSEGNVSGTPMECIMKASVGIGLRVDCHTSFLARLLYVKIDGQGNTMLLDKAAPLSMKRQAELAVDYRTWAKEFVRADVMRRVMHDDLGVMLLDLREERKFGALYTEPFSFECMQACRRLELEGCSLPENLPEHLQHSIYFEVVQGARSTNADVNTMVNNCPKEEPLLF
mmetsp:Transcript_66090/g.123278  ORF Transcript_66090/g.123278 Transcript_66090/m.123278 type:complete len:326 (+) Transcript_66090:104-1081(+)